MRLDLSERLDSIGIVDVQYHDDGGARAALVVCAGPTCELIRSEHVTEIGRVEPYQPGALYRRELPCLLQVLALGPRLDLLLVDGYATLDGTGRPGLGAHAAEACGLPVIGVAKTAYRNASHAALVRRGAAAKPLYVTVAGGLDLAEAARLVAGMAGPYRLPTALWRVDALARGRAQPIAASG